MLGYTALVHAVPCPLFPPAAWPAALSRLRGFTTINTPGLPALHGCVHTHAVLHCYTATSPHLAHNVVRIHHIVAAVCCDLVRCSRCSIDESEVAAGEADMLGMVGAMAPAQQMHMAAGYREFMDNFK